PILWGFSNAPLMYFVVFPIYVLTRISPIFIYKAMGPVLFGVLCLVVFRFCKKKLGLSGRNAFLSILFLSFYFVSLRVAWDAYQAELGLIFFILGLTAVEGPRSATRATIAKSAFFLLAVLASQLVGVLVIGTVIVEVLRTKGRGSPGIILSRLAPVALFGLVVYATLQTSLGPGVLVPQG